MLYRIHLLLFLIFLSTAISQAQQLPPEVVRLKAEVAKAKALLEQLQKQRDSLQALSDALQDTASLHAALDSLQYQYADTLALTQQADSLQKAFDTRQITIKALDRAEAALKEEINKATQALARKLLLSEAEAALASLQKAGAASAQALPSPPSIQSNLQNLPAPQQLQGLAKARAAKAAGNHLSGQKAELNKARQELNKYKGRFEKVESVKNMPKGFLKLNPLKDKPWQERVVIGTLWQFGNQERFLLDVGPYAAWRFTDKLSTGMGVQYRLSVSVKESPWVSGEKVGGVFAFTDVDVYKGIFARVNYEHLSAPVPVANSNGQAEEMHQVWVPGLSVGAGKTYTFYKMIQGYALVQYNLLHEHGRTPYQQPLQARIGFNILASSFKGKKK